MPWIHSHYRVQDYNRWKQVYDATAGVKRRYGWKRYPDNGGQSGSHSRLLRREREKRRSNPSYIGPDAAWE